MTKNTVIDFTKPSDFSPDPLTDVLRAGARELLAKAVRAEVSEFMDLSRNCAAPLTAYYALKENTHGNETNRRI